MEREQVVELGTKVTLLDCHVCVRDDTHPERVVIVHPDCCKTHGREGVAHQGKVRAATFGATAGELIDGSESNRDHPLQGNPGHCRLRLPDAAAPPPDDGYGLVERFWEAGWPSLAACDDECGTCKPCVAHWAVGWSLAVLSNPALVAKAEQDGPWKWTTTAEPVVPAPVASLERVAEVLAASFHKSDLTDLAWDDLEPISRLHYTDEAQQHAAALLSAGVFTEARPEAEVKPDRERLARILDPDIFDESIRRSKSHAAAVQIAARQHMAYEAADRLLAAGAFRSEAEVKAEALREAADDSGVNVTREDSEWWSGYRQAQRETIVRLTERAAALRAGGQS